MSDKMNCPFSDCSGELDYIAGQKTLAGFTYLDQNEVYETFECNKCKKTVCRNWKWEELIYPPMEG